MLIFIITSYTNSLQEIQITQYKIHHEISFLCIKNEGKKLNAVMNQILLCSDSRTTTQTSKIFFLKLSLDL